MRPAALLLLLLASLPSAQAWPPALAPAGQLLDASPLGGLLQGAIGLAPREAQSALVAQGGGAGADCGGTAPITVACSKEFNGAAGSVWRLAIVVGTGFTGVVTNTLIDPFGRSVTVTCSYLAWVDDASTPPACATGGEGGLSEGRMTLRGAATGHPVLGGVPPVGYWEVRAQP